MSDPMTPEEGWYGGSATMAVNVQVNCQRYAYMTLPREVARLIVLDICKTPVPIRNGFYEFLQFGVGLQPRSSSCGNGTFSSQNCGCSSITAAFERDNVFTLSDFAGTPQIIRIFPTDNADLGKRVLVQGPDQNGVTVLSTDALTGKSILGEYVYLGAPFAQTVNQFSSITGLNKQQTAGFVKVFMVDPSTGAQVPLSSMEPNETTSSYRRYLLNGMPRNCCTTPENVVTITAQARLDLIPVQSDPDYLLINSLPALIEEAQSIRYSRMDTPSSAALEEKHHRKALAYLNGQLDLYEGKVSTAIGVSLFGAQRLRPSFA